LSAPAVGTPYVKQTRTCCCLPLIAPLINHAPSQFGGG